MIYVSQCSVIIMYANLMMLTAKITSPALIHFSLYTYIYKQAHQTKQSYLRYVHH